MMKNNYKTRRRYIVAIFNNAGFAFLLLHVSVFDSHIYMACAKFIICLI